MRGPKRFGELHGGIAADGMTDNGDRLGVAVVIADGLIGYTAPAMCELVLAATPPALMRFASSSMPQSIAAIRP